MEAKHKISAEDLKLLQGLCLDLKIQKTRLRLLDVINTFGVDGVYLSFSGGKDSTVLHCILLDLEMELWGECRIVRVFCDTGLEYPELKAHVKKIFATLPEGKGIIIRPDKSFKQVLSDYGYPILSKSHSFALRKLTKQNLTDKYRNKILWGDERGSMGRLPEKYHYLQDVDFDISEQCCDVMKKRPFKIYEKQTKQIPILAVMACESSVRKTRYLNDGGCNAFNNKRPQSKPMGFWLENDILEYIHRFNIELPSVYGKVVCDCSAYKLTGVKRTGCMFCMFGCHCEDSNNNRFHQMKKSHPKLYNYCIDGGCYDSQGRWKPSAEGLGLGHVLDTINVNYK